MKKFQGSSIATIPREPGIYAWYYRPRNYKEDKFISVLSKIFDSPGSISVEIKQRYGCFLKGSTELELLIGSQRKTVHSAANQTNSDASALIEKLTGLSDFVNLTRPLYIGIAATEGNTLYERVYKQHYLKLVDMWSDRTIANHLSAKRSLTVQAVMDDLSIPHSFALEARVKGIAANDLQATVVTLSELGLSLEAISRNNLEAAEDLLQLISDPLFGRT